MTELLHHMPIASQPPELFVTVKKSCATCLGSWGAMRTVYGLSVGLTHSKKQKSVFVRSLPLFSSPPLPSHLFPFLF